MHKRLLHLLAAAMLFPPFAALAETPKMRMCYEAAEFQPYFNGADQVPPSNPGLIIEQLVIPAANAAGFSLELYRRPWNRCMSDMQKNIADAILPAAWTPQRESWARYPGPDRNIAGGSDPAFSDWAVSYAIIVASDSPLGWDGNSFHNLQNGLGAPLGHLTNDRLNQLGVLQSSNIRPEAALKMIVHHRLDGYVLEELTARALINQNGLQAQLQLLPIPLFRTDWYVPVTHKFYAAYPEQVWHFWEALVEQRRKLEPQLQQQLNAQAMHGSQGQPN
jgi:polar amino acid transport system substrate-binding protein